MMISNKVYKDDIEMEQMIHWFILSDLIKYIDGSLDMTPRFDCETIRLQTTQKTVSQFENRQKYNSRYKV